MTREAGVAAGSAPTAAAAAQVLAGGGNAFDAAVAAGFAAAVAEPTLASLGGGGFLLAAPAGEPAVLVDFFVDAPGRGRAPERLVPSFLPVTVRFAGADQVFHAGWGSVAVPGCLDGYLHVHRRFGRLPLADVVAPARRLAADGVAVDQSQGDIFVLLREILTATEEGRALFAPEGRLLVAGEVLRNAPLADVLADVADGRVRGFADLGAAVDAAATVAGALISRADLDAYRVVERVPLDASYRGCALATNPPPSFGGTLVAAGLAALGRRPPLGVDTGSVVDLAEVLVAMSERHVAAPRAVRGTTHVSVVDGEGSLASLTVSNGSCSGVFAPGTGIQLNNVMGEADLHPDGFHVTPPGVRIGSMMSPTVVSAPDGTRVALGSGGSERIRSALTCTLSAVLDRGLDVADAVAAPRLHWDRAQLQVEPGLPAPVLAALAERWPVHAWQRRDLYFGGVHAVQRRPDGTVTAVGDPRRGGVGLVLRG